MAEQYEETEVAQLDVDTVTPASQALLVETANRVIHQHGGVATRISFGSLSVMDIPTFLASEVPKIKKADRSEDMYILRDSAQHSVAIIFKDEVHKYDVTNLEDVPLDLLYTHLRATEVLEYIPNIPYPIIADIKGKTYRNITIRLENFKATFKAQKNYYGKTPIALPIYYPPMWLRITLNAANTICAMGLAVERQKELDVRDTVLCHPCLPNIFNGLGVCLGGSHISAAEGIDTSKINTIIQLAITQLFNSNWNTDLILSSSQLYAVIGDTAYSYVSKAIKDDVESRMADMTVNSGAQLKLLACMTIPTGWQNLRFPSAGITAEKFLRSGMQ